MANQLMVNHFPAGFDNGTGDLTVNGSVILAGSAVSTGEPINWNNMMTGLGYNEINYRGNGQNGGSAAFTTGFAVSAGTCTVTANNNFQAGWQVVFLGNTQTLSALFNNVAPVTIVTATATTFTFTTTQTGTTTTGDVGLAVIYRPVQIPEPGESYTQNLTVTALSASGTTLTITAANKLLPGAYVVVSVATGTLGPKLAGLQLPVIQSTGSAFTATMPSALTGTTGTGTAVGINGVVPYSVKVWSELASGYVYQYNSTFGTLFVMDVIATGTNDSSTPPVFTGTAAALQKLAAAAYPAGVLADVIKYEARFARG
jgi:hypothetical protein